jgi:DNA-binding transcriptional LysR family regulator
MKLSSANLRLFALIADLGGISAAARNLGVQKSTVSRELALMEAQVGHRLFERTTRHLRPTEAGSLLLAYAHRVAEEIDAAEVALEALSAEPAGNLLVSTPQGVAQQLIVPLLPDFRRRYPKIRVGLDLSSHYVDLLQEGIDVALRVGELAPSSLVARRLGTIRMILAAAPDFLARRKLISEPADLEHCEHIGLGSRPGLERLVLHKGNEVVDVEIDTVLAGQSTDISLELVRSGLGIATLPISFAERDISVGRLVHVLPDWHVGTAPLHAIYPSRRLLTPKVRVFIDAVAGAIDRDRGHATMRDL